jgi:hypothetical protein
MEAHRVSSWARCAAMAALGLVLAVGLSGTAGGEAVAAGFEIALATDKAIYRVGEPIAMTLTVSNRAAPEIRLEFSSAQRFDFAIRDAKKNQIWRWSEGQMFGQMLGAEAIGPARPQIIYRAQFTGALPPGIYRLEGILVATDRPLSATLVIQVQ